MTVNERLRKVRLSSGLTQKDFAERIGIKQNTVASYEIGRIAPSETVLVSICREYNVNYDWLLCEEGEMFSNVPKTVLEEVYKQYDLDELDQKLVEMYIELPNEVRTVLKDMIRKKLSGINWD